MHLDHVKGRVRELGWPDADDIHPCTPEEVAQLETKLACRLPEALREFLLWCGNGLGDLWSGSRCLEYEDLLDDSTKQATRDRLARDGLDPAVLDEHTLVFQYDECDQFSFVRTDEGEDPPVYTRAETGPVRRSCDRFSDYVVLVFEQAAGITDGEEQEEAAWNRLFGAGGVPGNTAAGAEAAVEAVPQPAPPPLPPELASDPQRFEVSPGALPPSLQHQLGGLVASFKPSAANAFAMVVFGVGLLAGGLVLLGLGIREAAAVNFTMPLSETGGMSWVLFGLMELFSVGLAVAGALLLRQARRVHRSSVFVGPAGLCVTGPAHPQFVRWAEVGEIQEVVLRDHAPINSKLRYLLPIGKTRRYVLRSAGGQEHGFDDNNVRSLARFRKILEHVASTRGIPWSVVEARA
jgi:hypothetical protein